MGVQRNLNLPAIGKSGEFRKKNKITVNPSPIIFSDYRSNIGPSDSERDCPSRRDSESSERWREKTQMGEYQPRLGVIQTGNDSESGGSHSPSPRAARKRQVAKGWLIMLRMNFRILRTSSNYCHIAEVEKPFFDVVVFVESSSLFFHVPGDSLHFEETDRRMQRKH